MCPIAAQARRSTTRPVARCRCSSTICPPRRRARQHAQGRARSELEVRMTRAAALLLALLAGCASGARDDFSFALIGDLGYTPAQEPMVDRVFGALNAERLAFVVHDGDLGS